jgi:sugar-specific transcriptional regulator TrmB
MENEEKSQKTTTWRFLDTLLDLGLGTSGAKIYELLLEKGSMKASSIAKYLGLSRVITYRHLGELEKAGVITRNDPDGAVSLFAAAHPAELSRVLEQKKARISKAELELQHQLGRMASLYNLAGGKSNVRFFEGKEAIREITSDYPTSDTEIRQWMDLSATLPHMGKEVISYLKIRIRKNITKRMLVADNEQSIRYARTGSPKTDFRFTSTAHLPSAIQVYDNTVAILTVTDTSAVGVMIQDPAIATTMKAIFDTAWMAATPASSK